MDNFEWLYDHYKETNTLSREAQKNRNKFFVYLCIGLTCLFMFIVDTNAVKETIGGLYAKKISDTGISFHINIVQSFVWVINLYLFIRYIQSHVYVERQYKYIEELEVKISELSGIDFTRESKNYLNNYPKISNFIHIVYFWFFPIVSFIIVFIKIANEWMFHIPIPHSLFDTLVGLIILIMLILYFLFLHPIRHIQN